METLEPQKPDQVETQSAQSSKRQESKSTPTPPNAMLAELTHRCPLRCPYCSNPKELAGRNGELSTEKWIDVFHQAAKLGVLHVHLSGGEPASRNDLVELTKGAIDAGLYTNLITSGVGLTEKRLTQLSEIGLDHIQLSIQGATPDIANHVGGYKRGFETKMNVAEWVHKLGIPLTVNAVMHRQNLHQLEDVIELTLKLGARRLEIANTQYHGWAYVNRSALMPTSEQSLRAKEIVDAARERLKGKLVFDYVPSDHHSKYPKACMGGWAKMGLVVTPHGKVLPCHAAESITTFSFDTVHQSDLTDIWYNSDVFNAYRGFDWMSEPCRSCDRKTVDFGGCRCQAFAWAGDAGATDPVCIKSPLHEKMSQAANEEAGEQQDRFIYREMPKD